MYSSLFDNLDYSRRGLNFHLAISYGYLKWQIRCEADLITDGFWDHQTTHGINGNNHG